jgi:hypothetical protein
MKCSFSKQTSMSLIVFESSRSPAISLPATVIYHLQRLHANRRNESRQDNAGKTDRYREQPRHDMLRRKIAVTYGKTGHEGEIKRFTDPPALNASDEKSESSHGEKNPGENRPYHAKLLHKCKEEGAPHLP